MALSSGLGFPIGIIFGSHCFRGLSFPIISYVLYVFLFASAFICIRASKLSSKSLNEIEINQKRTILPLLKDLAGVDAERSSSVRPRLHAQRFPQSRI